MPLDPGGATIVDDVTLPGSVDPELLSEPLDEEPADPDPDPAPDPAPVVVVVDVGVVEVEVVVVSSLSLLQATPAALSATIEMPAAAIFRMLVRGAMLGALRVSAPSDRSLDARRP
ncbi:MAG: hypothetical protein ACOYOQ_13675 [Microthrixaceae bacterium]